MVLPQSASREHETARKSESEVSERKIFLKDAIHKVDLVLLSIFVHKHLWSDFQATLFS